MGDIATALTVGDVATHLNITSPTGSQDAELEGFLLAADAHVTDTFGPLINVLRTQSVSPSDWVLWLTHAPVLSVTSVTQGTTAYTTGITFSTAGRVYFAQVNNGAWDVVYRSGWLTLPADLRLAVLEDIRGLCQRGQLGPPGAIGAFGMDAQGPSFRPVNMWPRIDEWIGRRSPSVGVA